MTIDLFEGSAPSHRDHMLADIRLVIEAQNRSLEFIDEGLDADEVLDEIIHRLDATAGSGVIPDASIDL